MLNLSCVVFITLFLMISVTSSSSDELIEMKFDKKHEVVFIRVDGMLFSSYEKFDDQTSVMEESGLSFEVFNQRVFVPIFSTVKSGNIDLIKKSIARKHGDTMRWIQVNMKKHGLNVNGDHVSMILTEL